MPVCECCGVELIEDDGWLSCLEYIETGDERHTSYPVEDDE